MSWNWILLNKKTQMGARIQGGTAFSFGNESHCEVQVSCPQPETILGQVYFEDGFVFVSSGNAVAVHYLRGDLRLGTEVFALTSESEQHPFEAMTVPESLLTSLFCSSGFKKVLREVQFFESDRLKIQGSAAAEIEKDTICSSIGFLSAHFWENHAVSKPESRQKYLQILWCVWAQMCRFGILTPLLADDSISEVMVSEPRRIYIERNGRIESSELAFEDNSTLMTILERIVSRSGRRIDESIPFCDARLPDGSRVHAIIPPLALNGPCLTIRKFPAHALRAERLVELGSMSQKMYELLKELVEARSNVLIAGGTGSGKTTLLNSLSSFIPAYERLITIEDSAELQLQQPHVIRLESRLPNMEGKGAVTLRDLVRNALRMRPDRVIVGECRGGEALDMLQAMNTGHDGSMTTVHANSAVDALRRLETLVMFSGVDLPLRAIREQIVSAVHYVVQQTRFANGKRCISAIHKVERLDEGTGTYVTVPLVTYQKQTGDWRWHISCS